MEVHIFEWNWVVGYMPQFVLGESVQFLVYMVFEHQLRVVLGRRVQFLYVLDRGVKGG